MPALYRMPAFYVLALIFAGLYATLRPAPPPPEVAPATEVVAVPGFVAVVMTAPPGEVAPATEVVAVPPKVPDDVVEVEGGSTGDGILRTAQGLRRKVVVKDLAVACRSDPGGGRVVGPPLDYFAIRYVFGDDAERFRVGPRGGPPQGWVPASSVLEWDTRLMARPTAREGRPALKLYRDESCLLHAIDDQPCPRHPDGCPTEGEEPAEVARGTDRPPMGFPILASKVVDGRTIFEVASLVKDQASAPILPSEPPADLRPYLKIVDIAFVIDTTASMQGTIDSARRLASELVESASKRYADVTLRFALVEYRDASPHYGFKARLVTPFTNASGFLDALKRIAAATKGDGSVDERVFDGVALGLPRADDGGEHVDWPTGRAGELATKLLILLGDAPDHDHDLDRANALAALAKSAGITIATVAIDRPGTLSRDEQSRYRDQWRTLAEGSYRPMDKAGGFARPIEPLALSIGDGEALVVRLQALIDDRVEQARSIAALAAAEAEGRLGEYVNSQGLTLDRVAPVLVDLHRGEAAKVARPDPRFDGRKAPSVRRGWVAERLGGKSMLSVEILMSRAELTTLIDELTQIQQAASGTARDIAELLQIGTAAASGETSFLGADRGKRTIADHLRRRQGLPPPRPDSLLGRSQGDLLRADDVSLGALDARVRASVLMLTRRLKAPDWDDPRSTIDGMALVPFEAIDF